MFDQETRIKFFPFAVIMIVYLLIYIYVKLNTNNICPICKCDKPVCPDYSTKIIMQTNPLTSTMETVYRDSLVGHGDQDIVNGSKTNPAFIKQIINDKTQKEKSCKSINDNHNRLTEANTAISKYINDRLSSINQAFALLTC
jgi:hypothetical protein